ncbi:PilZ domain-containing protein [Aureimonas psammosilenae]|uniref:PilZ domain-containing protein n=1 Tax=Aureimonas psammosilenae TaxID=2495496 RepID=UPI0012613A86|nr:PilZ domain-containing protein [Aureimonas psammosilenae]
MSALIHEQPKPFADAVDDAERRIAPRTKVLKRGQVVFNNNFSTFDCIVRNISATGALLTLDDAAHLPKEFGLRIGDDRTLRPARLVYRRGALAGIRFLDYVEPEEDLNLPPSAETSAHPAAAPSYATISKIHHETLPTALMRNFRWF